MLLGILGVKFIRKYFIWSRTNKKGWEINRSGEEEIAKRQGQGIVRAGYGNKKNKLDF